MSKTLEEMTTPEKIDWAAGSLVIAIGKGDFRSEVGFILVAVMNEAYHRGFREGKKAAKAEAPAISGDTKSHFTTLAYMIRDAANRMTETKLQKDRETYDRLVGLFNLPDDEMIRRVSEEVEANAKGI